MSLRIISGRSGSGKTTVMQQEIVDQLKREPFGKPIYIIVPDQMSFMTEYDLTNRYDIKGMMRAQVLSFKRFAWFILQQTGGIAKDKVDPFGYRMLIRQVLEEKKDELQLFRQAATKRGFTKEIETLIRELTQYNVTSETIGPIIAQLEEQQATPSLIQKFRDFAVLIRAVEERLGDRYVDGESFYPILTRQLEGAQSVKGAHIYFDGFTRFSKREFDVVMELLKVAERVTVLLPFEKEEDAARQNDDALFHQAAATYDRLVQAAFELGIEVEPRVQLEMIHRFRSEDLQHMERNFDIVRPEQKRAVGDVQIIEAANRRAEVHAIAREIRSLVMRDNGMQYRDIGIMYRQPDVYDSLIATTFKQYDIPYFLNEKRPMLHHPLIELVRSALEVIQSNWQYEPIFRGVKTDLYFPKTTKPSYYREMNDQLENFVIARGVVGRHRWLDDSYWTYKRYRTLEKMESTVTTAEEKMQRLLDEARDMIRQPLERLEKRLTKAVNGREMAMALYQFVDELDVYKKLELLYKQEIDEASFSFASEHEQVWNSWVNVLDQFVVMFGEESLSLDEMIQVLDEGYDALQFSTIPPSVDEVTVMTADFARFDNRRVVFIIGFNDGVYPTRIDREGLISDVDRELLGELGVELAPSTRSRLLQEAYVVYRSVASPAERLYVTFANADEEGKELLPSVYIARLHKMFEVGGERTLPHMRVYADPSDELEEERMLSYISHPAPSLGYLTMQLKQAEHTGQLAKMWVSLQETYRRDDKWRDILQTVTKPLYKRNRAETLQERVVEQLYGTELAASVSRIEQFYRCPFAHFSSYGLRLQERAEYKLESFAMGDLFHEALRMILANKRDEQLPRDYRTCFEKAKETVDSLVQVFANRILESSARYTYIKNKLTQIVARTLFALIQHESLSKFKPIVHEKPFGKKDDKAVDEQSKPLPALEIPLANARKMTLRGQIDRIDAYEKEREVLLRVVDYKSSSRQLDLNEVYYGVSLQLMTYLQVALENARELVGANEDKDIIAVPAGMLYVHVHNPVLKLEEVVDEQMRELKRLEQYKMDGLVTNDRTILTAMDESLLTEKSSKVIPVAFAKDGVDSRRSKAVEQQDLPILSKFVLKKHAQAGEAIYAGETSIAPYRLKNKTACDYCAYKSICQFDASDGQGYNEFATLDKKSVIAEVRKECGVYDSGKAE